MLELHVLTHDQLIYMAQGLCCVFFTKYGRFRKDNKITVMMVHTVLKTGLTNGAVILLPLCRATLTHKNPER